MYYTASDIERFGPDGCLRHLNSLHEHNSKLLNEIERLNGSEIKEAFHRGMLAALAVVKDHDLRTLFDEIVTSTDAAELIAVARKDEQMEMSGLARYGYGYRYAPFTRD